MVFSACQRVSAGNFFKLRNSPFNPLMVPYCDSPAEFKVINWPQGISKRRRVPQTAGPRSFATVRHGNSPALFDHQRISISGHVVVVVDRGQLLIKQGQHQEIIRAGGFGLLSDGEFEISELAEFHGGSGLFTYFFFSTKVLATQVPHNEEFMLLFLNWSKHHPGNERLISGRLDLLDEFGRGKPPADILTCLLQGMVGCPFPLFAKLCARRVLSRRLRVLIFLENLVLAPSSDQAGILSKFPDGKNALRREMSSLDMPSIAEIVAVRRWTLLKLWREHAVPKEKILQAFHTNNPRNIFHHIPKPEPDLFLGAQPAEYEQLLAEPWPTQPKARALMVDAPCQTMDTIFSGIVTEDLYKQHPVFPDPRMPVPRRDPGFWDLKHTGIRHFIDSANLTTIPGLEDCRSLIIT